MERKAWNKEHAPGPMRAVRHPRCGAPWPLTADDGTSAIPKEPARILPFNKLAAMARDTKLRAGPAPGIADACSHPENSRNFMSGYTWALENKARYTKALAEQSEDYQRAKQLKTEQSRRQFIDATLKAHAPDADDSTSMTPNQHAEDEDEDDIAFQLFEQEYSGVVHAVWSTNKPAVRRAGGTGPLLRQVWARLPPAKRTTYRFRASKLRREQQRVNNPEFRLAMQQTNPAPLPEGSSASVEISMNWMHRALVSQSARDRQHVRVRSAGARSVKVQHATNSRPQSAALAQPTMVAATQSENNIVRPTSAPSVSVQLSASTINAMESCDSSWFDMQSKGQPGMSQGGKGGREPPALLRHGQNASIRMAGHHDSAAMQQGTVILKSSPRNSSAAVAKTKTKAKAKDEAIRYWQWKASEGKTKRQAPAPFIQAAIEQAKEQLSRPNSAGSSFSARTPASVGLVCSSSPAPGGHSASEEASTNSTNDQSEPAWCGPGVDGSGLRSASVSDMGRSLDAMPQQHSPVSSNATAEVLENDKRSGVERRLSVEMATDGIFARRRDRTDYSPPQSPGPVSHTPPRPLSAASSTATVATMQHQHSGSSIASEVASTTESEMKRSKGKSKKVVMLASDDDVDEYGSHTSSGHSDTKSEGQVQPAMESLRNYSSTDLKLVVRYHGRSKHDGNAENKKAVGVGARQRQRAASRRASAAATRVAEARRLLHCVGGQNYLSV
eukprot:COSAG02_NODE_1180_length_14037_cov_73.962907_2_plen_728_part_00